MSWHHTATVIVIGAALTPVDHVHGGGQVHVHVNDQGGVNVNDHVEVNVDVGELPTQDTTGSTPGT